MSPVHSTIQTENLVRKFDAVKALDGVSLDIRPGEFFSLLGPSGCGKTTLLRIIAGLEVPDAGIVRIGGVDATEIPAHRRPVNTVFQSYALFPHLNVWDNVAFGLRIKRVPSPEIQQRVERVMKLVEIGEFAKRRPSQISGGQKQRVALARAIVNEPQVLLLDEPLGALDLKLRKQLQIELRNLQRRLGITFVYVTHDQDEALVLSDRIAVMRGGRVEQLGEAAALYERPRTRFVSQFLGTCSLIEATVRQPTDTGFVAGTSIGDLQVTAPRPTTANCTLAIRPERIQLMSAGHGSGDNCLRVQVEQSIYVGAGTHYDLRSGTQLLQAEVLNAGSVTQAFRVGQEVIACLPSDALIVLED